MSSKIKFLKLSDIVIILFFTVAAAVSAAVLYLPSKTSVTADIYLDRELIYTLDLNTERHISVSTEHGEALIVTGNGRIHIESSPCPDKVCVKSGSKARAGDSIVCMPEKLMVILKGEGGADVYV